MKKVSRIINVMIVLLIIFRTSVYAHNGNISGWKDKGSEKIINKDGIYYGYHNKNGVRHYHEVKWNEQDKRWQILKTAVCYDENFNIINNEIDENTEKRTVNFDSGVDGDTAKFVLNGKNITVRFLGIDTPETVHPSKGEEPFGKEASNFTLEKLSNAKKIELEYDNFADKKDKYDRELAWVWIDDKLLQKELVENGLAKTYMLSDNYKYAGSLQIAEEEAKLNKIGIWSELKDEAELQNAEKGLEDDKHKDIIVEILGGIIFVTVILLKITKRMNLKNM